MRILYIIDGLPDGGLERQVVELLRGLGSQKGILTILCNLSRGGAREKEAASHADQLLILPGASNAGWALLLKFPYLVLTVLHQCRKLSPDLIHTYGCFSDIIGVVASLISNIPFVNGSIRAARPVLNYRDKISRLTFPYAEKIISNSQAGLNVYGVREKGVVIHNGIDLRRFEKVDRANVSGSPLLCMVGNFTDKKNQKLLIRCLPQLCDQFGELRLILVGKGRNVDSCRKYANQIGCIDNVTFVENCSFPEPYIASADICILISNIELHGEGISNAIMEYMALEKPVVATQCGGNGELIVDGVTGYLTKKNTAEELTEVLRTLLADKNLCRRMGLAGRKRVEQDFAISKMINSYTRLYHSIMTDSGVNERDK